MRGIAMDAARFAAAIAAIDEANRKDPNSVLVNGEPQPSEWLYSVRLSQWVKRLNPLASEALLLAARCQHIERWKLPRAQYPRDRKGYLEWRSALARFHASRAQEILTAVGYSDDVIRRVQELNLKQHLHTDPEMQVLEDALCLLFLETQFLELNAKTEEDKMVQILQRTWRKMSPQGRQEALKLELASEAREVLSRALGG
ncbi:MAG: DUF4202 domain-containing protein [Acidobacteriota bacterium]